MAHSSQNVKNIKDEIQRAQLAPSLLEQTLK
jgi:hypothetical protein